MATRVLTCVGSNGQNFQVEGVGYWLEEAVRQVEKGARHIVVSTIVGPADKPSLDVKALSAAEVKAAWAHAQQKAIRLYRGEVIYFLVSKWADIDGFERTLELNDISFARNPKAREGYEDFAAYKVADFALDEANYKRIASMWEDTDMTLAKVNDAGEHLVVSFTSMFTTEGSPYTGKPDALAGLAGLDADALEKLTALVTLLGALKK